MAFVVPKDLGAAIDAFFHGDPWKASEWWLTDNPMLGGMSPRVMLETRPDKLRSFIETSLAENGAALDAEQGRGGDNG